MCGRYKLSTPGDELWEYFDVHGEDLKIRLRYNIAPTDPVAVIRTPHQVELLRWGIKIPNPKAGGFNVRVESLGAPFYRDSIHGHRCLILADGFYEWQRLVEAKKPYLIQRHDRKPFVFAGMWDKVKTKTGEIVDACTILTTKPRGVISQIHDRMPVILPHDAMMQWIEPGSRYRDLLAPDADALELVAVSTHVNSVKNDDPRCAQPI